MKIKVESINCELNQGRFPTCFPICERDFVPMTTEYTIKVNVDSCAPNLSGKIREAIESLNNDDIHYVGGWHLDKSYSWRNEYQKERDKFEIKDVIFNDPATIVLWADGTKTVVKAENEPFDPEKGLAMAISKRALGDKYNYYDTFKKYVGRYEKKQKKGGK